MSKLASNNNKAVGPYTVRPPLPRLVYYYSGTKYYYPLIKPTSTLTWNGYIYSYDKSVGDTFGIGLSNTKYVVPNRRVPLVTYDIPAGTYVGQGAYDLFKKFISNNSFRTIKDSVTIRHMNITRTFNANTRVWLIYGYGGDCINLIFQTGPDPYSGVDLGYRSDYNDLWTSSSTNPGIQLHIYNGNPGWSTNNFTITGGIKFN